jgi:hypothetical protein
MTCMRVSMARVWCDPNSGACEVGGPTEPVESSKHFVEKLSAGRVQVARCDFEGQVVFIVFDLGRASRQTPGSARPAERLLLDLARQRGGWAVGSAANPVGVYLGHCVWELARSSRSEIPSRSLH